MGNETHIPGLIRGHEGTIMIVPHGRFEGTSSRSALRRRAFSKKSLKKNTVLSRSTFQPLNQWLWRVVPRADSLAVGMTLEARLVMTTIGSCNAFGCNCDVQQNSEVPTFPLHAFNIPYPPVV